MRKSLLNALCLTLFLVFPVLAAESGPDNNADASRGKAAPDAKTLVAAARNRDSAAFKDFCRWAEEKPERYEDAHVDSLGLSDADGEMFRRLQTLARLVRDAGKVRADALVNPPFDKTRFHLLIMKAIAADKADSFMTIEAVERITRAWRDADALTRLREEVLTNYHDEARRGDVKPGTRFAWSIIRIGAASPDTILHPGDIRYDADSARGYIRHADADIDIALAGDDFQNRIRATVNGYGFRTGWATLLQKPLGWMAEMARHLADAGVPPDMDAEWEIMEAPEGLIALAPPVPGGGRGVPEKAFYKGTTRRVEAVPVPPESDRFKEDFLAAAKALHEGVTADESIPRQLRQALAPILAGTYLEVDKRDYFDNDFCRRLIEADYLETFIKPMPAARAGELRRYREALANIEAGIDRFVVDLGENGRLVAVSRPDIDRRDGDNEDVRDPETGETVSRYQWRWEQPGRTTFHSPLPGRYLYAMSLLEHYDGTHKARPAGVPAETEVWHALLGRVAAYRDGDDRAVVEDDRWQEAVELDARGRRDPNSGPLGWNFPPFVPVRDDQGDPVLIATARGVVAGPDFSAIRDGEERRRAQDAWLDHTAAILATPGEMNLIFQIFFRYCSDSPLPELPNLIGSHYGLSDTHQTVHQSLDRRWVGRLIGDCDDLAEFFQNLAIRQGRLSHVMQLPAHAAAGWLEKAPEGGYQFVVLQTGPVLRFVSDTREGAVEKAYRYFDNEDGGGYFTLAAVPILLRFADEETRTPFVLSARIYWDREYAEKMIEVQGNWHLHVFSSAIETMEEMLGHDREVGNVKELASLYEQVGDYEKSATLREEELELVKDDPMATLSTLLDISQLRVRAKNKSEALLSLGRMREVLSDLRTGDPDQYEKASSFRFAWAVLLARLGEPENAWELIRYDVDEAEKLETFSDALLRTLVSLYDRMSIQRDRHEDTYEDSTRIRFAVRGVLAKAFGQGFFRKEDSYNKMHSRYFLLGRYGVAVAGRRAGLDALYLDGPYPAGSREHSARTEDLSEEDWEWFRIMPRLYLANGLEMLDREDHPELYDPAGAKRCLELVARAADKGAELGAGGLLGQDAVMKSAMVLAFINRDLDEFGRLMEKVRLKDYSSLYDDAAVMFGVHCDLVPLSEFPDWIAAFHKYFPGRQHYYKAAYRALSKGHFDHAVALAEATAGFFPDDRLLVDEAAAVKEAADRLRRLWRERGMEEKHWALRREREVEAATWLRDIVEVAVGAE